MSQITFADWIVVWPTEKQCAYIALHVFIFFSFSSLSLFLSSSFVPFSTMNSHWKKWIIFRNAQSMENFPSSPPLTSSEMNVSSGLSFNLPLISSPPPPPPPLPSPTNGNRTSTANPLAARATPPGKHCWVCFATDEDDYSACWVSPCRCRGTAKWVHQECLQRWVDEKQQGSSGGRSTFISALYSEKGR